MRKEISGRPSWWVGLARGAGLAMTGPWVSRVWTLALCWEPAMC